MKRLLLVALPLFVGVSLCAQALTCEPDTTLPDSVLIFPLPYSDSLQTGGISDTACLNTPYSFTFTLNIPDTVVLEFQGEMAELPIQDVNLNTTGAIQGLPSGMSYVCNPPNCIFPANTTACVVIGGTANDTLNLGKNELTITGNVRVNTVINFPVSFPDTTGTFPEGEYAVYVRSEDAPSCLPSSTFDPFGAQVQVRSQPNPTTGLTQIYVESERNGNHFFRIFNLSGHILHEEMINLTFGENNIPFDGSNLPSGMYLYAISNGSSMVTKKLIIAR